MSIVALLRESLAPAVDLVYPPRCPLCGEAIEQQSGLCGTCWTSLAIPGKPACGHCQRPFRANQPDGSLCAPCLERRPRHDGIAAATLYNDASRRLVLAFKHGRRIALAPMLARLMLARLPELNDEWLIVPVPLHRWRLWRRGYNQAALLARELARTSGAGLLVDALIRTRTTRALGGLGRRARQRTLAGAIAANTHRKDQVRGRKILLVDDVLTSGATSNACVALLKRAGAREVVIACFARVIDDTATQHERHSTNETPGI